MNFLLVFFAVFWSAGWLTADGVFFRFISKQVASLHYPAVEGTVTHSEARIINSRHGGWHCSAVMKYRYKVGRWDYTGSTVKYSVFPDSRQTVEDFVRTHPVGSSIQVFYDPQSPPDSLLLPGINGADFLRVLLLTPFNMMMLGMWVGLGGGLKKRIGRQAAIGGRRIFAEGTITRVRLITDGAAMYGLVTPGGLAIVSMFMLGFSTHMQPSVGLAVTFIVAGHLAGLGVYLWQWWKIRAGGDDLEINETHRTLLLPPMLGRSQRLLVCMEAIENVIIDQRILQNQRRNGVGFIPTLRMRSPDRNAYQLGEWINNEGQAAEFASWLRPKLGL